jgi:HTH-type transcriptional regulator/antitoxin HigA
MSLRGRRVLNDMIATKIQQATVLWPSVSNVLYVPHSESQYDEAVSLLDNLIDEVGENEDHPLASLMEVLGVLIEKYEDDHIPEITAL